MTQTEVLRLALEALETSMYPQQKQLQAITAIKAALEAKDEPVMCGACNGSGHMVRDPDIGTDQECFVCEGSGVFEDTAPPQRTWVALTGEEKIIMSRYDLEYAALIGEVERKLKEKNT